MRCKPTQAVGLWAAVCLLLAGPVAAQQIGVVASVDPAMRGQAPGGAAQTKAPGSAVVANETISTSSSGRGQILFRDQTTLTVSPDSEIVLDGFVFDPQGGGQTGLSLTRGALRLIGGKNSREREAVVRTPTAIIGVRGSSALITVDNNRTRAILIAGDRLCVGGAGGASQCTNRQGGIMTETGYAGQISQSELLQIIARIDGPPSQDATFQAPGGGGGGGGTAGAGLGGGTGIAEVTGPGSDPVSSRGALRDFQVFDDDVRSDAIVGITSSDLPTFAAPTPEGAAEAPQIPPQEIPVDLPDPQPLPDTMPDPMPDPLPQPPPDVQPDPPPDPDMPDDPDDGDGPPIIIIEPL